MKSRSRSLTGALVAVLAVPIFLGLTACLPSLPVPVGDPEKSRVDPYISGIWMLPDEEVFYVFEPYDKRTWIITAFDLTKDRETCADEFAAVEPGDVDEDDVDAELADVEFDAGFYDRTMAEIEHVGTQCYEVDRGPGAIKAWRTKLGGEWFMTWESLGVFDADRGFKPEEWIVFRLDTSVPEQLSLQWLDTTHDVWEKIEEMEEGEVTRRDVEKIIRKNVDVEEFLPRRDNNFSSRATGTLPPGRRFSR